MHNQDYKPRGEIDARYCSRWLRGISANTA